MGRRSVYIISILLLCFLSGACDHRTNEGENGEPKITDTPEIREAEGIAASEVREAEGIAAPEGRDLEGSTAMIDNKGQETGTGEGSKRYTNKNNQEEPGMSNRSDQEGLGRMPQQNKVIEAVALEAYSTQEELMEGLRRIPAGTVMKLSGAEESLVNRLFYMEELSEEVKARIQGKSYGENCDLPYEELRYIRVLYHAFDGTCQIGELIVNRAIAQDILDIFRELYALSYPIEHMVLIDEYDADDERSMAANNSSAFNYRYVAGTTRLSKHSLGWAIDINPLYNPYITRIDGEIRVLPENGKDYADREKDCPYYIRKGDACYEAFISRGFTWGGDWKNSKDYQHFEKIIDKAVHQDQ